MAPFYKDGVQSLLKICVTDQPLLELAKTKAEILAYVHVVKEFLPLPITSDGESSTFEESCEEDENWHSFDEDSASEAEFE